MELMNTKPADLQSESSSLQNDIIGASTKHLLLAFCSHKRSLYYFEKTPLHNIFLFLYESSGLWYTKALSRLGVEVILTFTNCDHIYGRCSISIFKPGATFTYPPV